LGNFSSLEEFSFISLENLMSIISFPDRGPWGKSSWRGNCSGHVYRDLFNRLQPKLFVDPMAGSFTSIDVAKEMGIKAVGLDLHAGFNILRDSILEKVGEPSDLCVSHPPYGGMILYSGENAVWGTQAHPDDLSHCVSDEDFHEKMQVALLNQRASIKNGGVYGTIIGDWRRNGIYTSYQAECISRMPQDELLSVIIKAQHNTQSESKSYGKMAMPFIMHEYILLWRKKVGTTYHLLHSMATNQAMRVRATWKAIIKVTMMSLGGKAALQQVYEAIANNCPENIKTNPNWQAKVRQTLNSSTEYFSEQRGVWAIA
jgi:hypothetical protein